MQPQNLGGRDKTIIKVHRFRVSLTCMVRLSLKNKTKTDVPSRKWAEDGEGRAQAPPGGQHLSAEGPGALWLGPHPCLETQLSQRPPPNTSSVDN